MSAEMEETNQEGKKPNIVAIAAVLLFLALLGGGAVLLNSQNPTSGSNEFEFPQEEQTENDINLDMGQPSQGQNPQDIVDEGQVSEMNIEDIVTGEGKEAVVGSSVTVHYVGTFTNGTKFDSSVDRGTPFTFSLGAGEVIAGWDQGVAGMKVGGKRKLVIPADLAYGAAGIPGAIPPNSTLVFEVELLEVE